jgi:hypothetical protein
MSGDSEPDTGPYSALRPLDEALPGDLDGEGWGSDDDWDYRGPATCVPPPFGAQAPRRRRGGWGVNSGEVVTRKAEFGNVDGDPGDNVSMASSQTPFTPQVESSPDGRTETEEGAYSKRRRSPNRDAHDPPPRRCRRLQDMAVKPATLAPPLVTQRQPPGASASLVGTRGTAGKSDIKKLSLTSDIDAQGDTPSLEGRRMPTASDGTLVFFSQPGEPSDETRTPRGVSKIAK